MMVVREAAELACSTRLVKGEPHRQSGPATLLAAFSTWIEGRARSLVWLRRRTDVHHDFRLLTIQ
jgi:hypothetical protein